MFNIVAAAIEFWLAALILAVPIFVGYYAGWFTPPFWIALAICIPMFGIAMLFGLDMLIGK